MYDTYVGKRRFMFAHLLDFTFKFKLFAWDDAYPFHDKYIRLQRMGVFETW